ALVAHLRMAAYCRPVDLRARSRLCGARNAPSLRRWIHPHHADDRHAGYSLSRRPQPSARTDISCTEMERVSASLCCPGSSLCALLVMFLCPPPGLCFRRMDAGGFYLGKRFSAQDIE